LAREGQVDVALVRKAISDLGVDTEKANPAAT
jgi:hypothetical protein